MQHLVGPKLKIIQPRRLLQLAALAVTLAGLPTGVLAATDLSCPDGQLADGVQRVGNSSQCLALRRFEPAGTSVNARVLVVFLPGASSGRVAMEEGGTAFSMAQALKATTIALMPPAAQADVYTPAQLDWLAASLAQLRSRNPRKKMLVVGHGGGAAMAALLASRYPASADAWLLAACPCDVPRWRESTKAPANTGAELSPQAELGRIMPATRIGVVVGNRDDSAVPRLSEAYVAGLQSRGVKTRLTYAVGATHVSVQRAPEFFMLAQSLVDDLSH